MIKFIKLTDYETGDPIWIEAHAAYCVYTDDMDGHTVVSIGDGYYVHVKEGPESVVRMLERSNYSYLAKER